MRNSNIVKRVGGFIAGTAGGLALIVNTASADRVRDFVDDLTSILTDKGYSVAVNDTLQPGGTYTADPETTTVKMETGEYAAKEIRGTEINAGAAITVNKMFVKDEDTSYVKIIFADEIYDPATDNAIQALNTNPERVYPYVHGLQLDSAAQIALRYFKIEPPVGVSHKEVLEPLDFRAGNEGRCRNNAVDLLGKKMIDVNLRNVPGIRIRNGESYLNKTHYRR